MTLNLRSSIFSLDVGISILGHHTKPNPYFLSTHSTNYHSKNDLNFEYLNSVRMHTLMKIESAEEQMSV